MRLKSLLASLLLACCLALAGPYALAPAQDGSAPAPSQGQETAAPAPETPATAQPPDSTEAPAPQPPAPEAASPPAPTDQPPAPAAAPATSAAKTPAPASAKPAKAPAPGPAASEQPSQGPHLLWVELAVGAQPMRVAAGGALAIHPDALFRVIRAKSDAWLDFGLSYQLAGLPPLDLGQYHSLSELLGDSVYSRDSVELRVMKGERLLGSVQIIPKFLPIDWLRRAEAATQPEERLADTAKALELMPEDRLLVLRMADLLIDAKRHAEAIALLEQQAWAWDDQAALSHLADLYQRQGQNDKAAQAVDKLSALSPRDPRLLERLAGLLEQLGKWEEATAVLERLSQVLPEDERLPIWLRIAQALQKAGKLEPALEVAERAARQRPGEAAPWQVLAKLRAQAGDSAGALEAQRRLAALAPSDIETHMRLVEAFLGAGRKAEAAAELEKAAQLQPSETSLWMRLLQLYQDLDDRPSQLRVYQRLTALPGHDPDLDLRQGVLLMDMDQNQQALASFQALAKARPQDPEGQRLMVDVLARLGRWDQVIALAKTAYQGRPLPAPLLEGLYAAQAQKQPLVVAQFLDQALKAGAQETSLYQLRATLALDQDQTEAAIAALELGVQNLPDDSDLALKLAGLYEAAGQDQKAARLYERLLDKNSSLPGLQERYLQLKTRMLDERNAKGGEAAPAAPGQ